MCGYVEGWSEERALVRLFGAWRIVWLLVYDLGTDGMNKGRQYIGIYNIASITTDITATHQRMQILPMQEFSSVDAIEL